ncbi:ATP-dependent protease ClpP, protease subunit [Orenia metallireducens]|uniref:ATP-dependent Clp protease proteolytic subunit n=1 Tax=Orenia metallireducens TaxID=1413210 RepID=A0A285G7L0_9FIRM|nr:head maturation protease, ClpP-related [Orenia metallireducens]SNY19388.1 ATP-dependent protease ClpP, protease subunit [Orenia metallireducens]
MEFPKIQTELKIENSLDEDKAIMYLSGAIRRAYPWEDENDCISAKMVKNKLKELSGENLQIRLNSPGGDVFESIEICNALKNYEGEVDVIVTSLAASGASIICTGADKVFMYANSMQMIHYASTFVFGNARELRRVAGHLDKVDEGAIKNSYMNKFVGTEEELEQLLDNEERLTAEECLAFGLCDQIIDEAEEPEEDIENKIDVKANLFQKYSNIKNKMNDSQQPDNDKSGLFNAFKK